MFVSLAFVYVHEPNHLNPSSLIICFISGQNKELFALNTPDFAAVVSSWQIGMSVSPVTEGRWM